MLYTNLGITGQTILLLAGIYGTVRLIMNVFSVNPIFMTYATRPGPSFNS